ncbi:MAG: hypothetical protein ACYTDY_20305 [Planctomycetota bacterium]|jgi:hypothetical protein
MPRGEDVPSGVWFRRDPKGFEVGASVRSPMFTKSVAFPAILLPVFIAVIVSMDLGPQALIPLLVVAVGLLLQALFLLLGKVTVTVSGDTGRIFTGVGRVGLSRSFPWSDILGAEEEDTFFARLARSFPLGDAVGVRIVLVGRRVIHFGGQLPGARREFVVAVLRDMMEVRDRRRDSSAASLT